MFFYVAVERDEYELPFCVETNVAVLAERVGVPVKTITSYVCKNEKRGTKYGTKQYIFYKIRSDE